MTDPQKNKEKIAISNRVKLPFAACWGEHILPAGEYDVIFMEATPLPLVIVIGMDTVAMIAPVRVAACEKASVNTLLFSPGQQPPHVHLLRLATLELDLRFEEGVAANAHPGVLALPLRLDARALAAAI
ncbi:MAG TPA: hypothetical protein VGX94_17435 [Terriglobia bacterium]|nr:hypothetical protein [Terriglobia bacterium]